MVEHGPSEQESNVPTDTRKTFDLASQVSAINSLANVGSYFLISPENFPDLQTSDPTFLIKEKLRGMVNALRDWRTMMGYLPHLANYISGEIQSLNLQAAQLVASLPISDLPAEKPQFVPSSDELNRSNYLIAHGLYESLNEINFPWFSSLTEHDVNKLKQQAVGNAVRLSTETLAIINGKSSENGPFSTPTRDSSLQSANAQITEDSKYLSELLSE